MKECILYLRFEFLITLIKLRPTQIKGRKNEENFSCNVIASGICFFS